jgi:preprotein translocase subunit SecD
MKKKNLLQRSIIIGIISVVSIYIVIGPHGRRPHGKDFTWSGIKQNLRDNIHLGLDLRGGSHLVMRVKVDDYLKRLSEDNATAAANAAKDAGFEVKDARAETRPAIIAWCCSRQIPAKAKDIQAAVEKKVDLSSNAGWSLFPVGQ